MRPKAILAITCGDLEGIGPEIVKKSINVYQPRLPTLVIGSRDCFFSEGFIKISEVEEIEKPAVYFLPVDCSETSEPSFVYVKTAADLALGDKISGIVTAPICKEKWKKASIQYTGHTEYFAKAAGVKDYAMAFWSPSLKVVLYTIHLPLQEVFEHIERYRIQRFIGFVNRELNRLFHQKFRFLVCGLNPHAGEGGILGREEIDEIFPALRGLKGGVMIEGIFSPDVAFVRAKEMKETVVICWYHDQGLIPFKLLSCRSGVNLTLGLPYIRTSPDHGTAFDIAGKDIADPSSMVEAIRLAEELIVRKTDGSSGN